MGLNTTVLVLNDYLGDILGDSNFGQKIVDAINEYRGTPVTVRTDKGTAAAVVVESQHSDDTTLIAVGGNHASVLYRKGSSGHHTREVQWSLLEEALDTSSRPGR